MSIEGVGDFIRFAFESPTGTSVFFLPKTYTEHILELVAKAGEAPAIVVPKTGLIVPEVGAPVQP